MSARRLSMRQLEAPLKGGLHPRRVDYLHSVKNYFEEDEQDDVDRSYDEEDEDEDYEDEDEDDDD